MASSPRLAWQLMHFTVTQEADRAQGMEILKVPLFTWWSKCRLEMPFLDSMFIIF